jgi:hypothetical protein
MGFGDAVVPGELIFVEEAPGVAEAERDEGKSGRDYSPATEIS